MCINLRGRHVLMAEQILHTPYIRPALQQMRRKTMTQRVWCDSLV
jgi:hypothetical protein